MVSVDECSKALQALGARLRAARLARNEPMSTFAHRIGVSVPTLRAMESGVPTVQIGYWVLALWAIGQLDDLDRIFEQRGGLIERAREARRLGRKRARRPVKSGS